ncbi:DNA-binding response regulator [Deinococcus indicus]|uniref:response regulator transcription factor n=1 Tax=Deinococcus indicus TaxID=223556 RepID=UPI001749952B|nr:response regulator transcription factor [Deinococcus indicus]GHG38366.1 DNA-binding response regulator [Deinococcus indicus]
MIRVVIAEDQTLVREGLRRMLEVAGDLTVVAEAEDGAAAVRTVPATRPDVLLLDYRMPRLDGLQVLRTLRERNELPPTLLLTTFEDPELLFQSVQAGARGFLLKDVSLPVLLEAVREVAAGGRWLQPVPTEPLQDRAYAAPDGPPVALTGREVEVLRLMAGGYSNREIGALIATTEGTVKGYVSSILSKLGARDRTRAVLKAIAARLL